MKKRNKQNKESAAIIEWFAQLVLPCSLRSHRKTNPTAESGCATLGLPARHPEKNRKIEIEKVKNGIQKYMAKKKSRSAWDATAANERFGVMAAVARRKCSGNLQLPAPQEVQWKPPLRQAATTLSETEGRRSAIRRRTEKKKKSK